MLFVLIGFIILLISFIVALTSLIREQSQRKDFEIYQEDLRLAVEEAPQELESEFNTGKQAADLVSKQAGLLSVNEPNLAEYAPFPWEDTSLDLESVKETEGIASAESLSASAPVLGENRDNLKGEVSLADLKKNFR